MNEQNYVKEKNVHWMQRALSALILVGAIAAIAMLFVTPLFGWDPIGNVFDAAFASHPVLTMAAVFLALSLSFWSDWKGFRRTGETNRLSRLIFCVVVALVAIVVTAFVAIIRFIHGVN